MADKYCEIKGDRPVLIHYFIKGHNDGKVYVCGELIKKIKPLYSKPYTSEFVGIYIVKQCEGSTLRFWDVEQITGKFFAIPYHRDNENVLVKRLH